VKPMELAAIVALTDAGKHASRLENQTGASPISALRSSFLPGRGATTLVMTTSILQRGFWKRSKCLMQLSETLYLRS